MLTDNLEFVIELLKAIDEDWALCDKSDEDDKYCLVNENRNEHPLLYPKKKLIQELETNGYIYFDEKKSDLRGVEREYVEFMDEYEPVWLVFFFHVTPKGRELVNV